MSDACKTPTSDLVMSAVALLEQGGAIRIMDIPGDRSFASHTFSGEVGKGIANLIAAAKEEGRIAGLREAEGVCAALWRGQVGDIALLLSDARKAILARIPATKSDEAPK